jgi:hypothetical protein
VPSKRKIRFYLGEENLVTLQRNAVQVERRALPQQSPYLIGRSGAERNAHDAAAHLPKVPQCARTQRWSARLL